MHYTKTSKPASDNEISSFKNNNYAPFVDSRNSMAMQLKMQGILKSSPQNLANNHLQRKLQLGINRSTQLNPAENAIVQRHLQEWENPFLTTKEKNAVPPAAKNSVYSAANAIDDGLEEGAKILRALWSDYQVSGDTNYLHYKLVKKSPPNAKKYIRNFINRITDAALKKKTYKPAKEAGYIVESFANQAAKAAGVETQVTIGTARPDYRKVTGTSYRQKNGFDKPANGLIDATSAAEAAKGHILSKMFKMSEDNARSHPILYDTYYDDLGLGNAPQVKVKLNPKIVEKRQQKWRQEREMAKIRRSSLRPRGYRRPNYRN